MNDITVEITPDLSIPMSEIDFRTSRSGGPGGQHVNTSSTRVELVWDVAASPSISEEQRARIQRKLAKRISAAGTLSISSSATRSQHRNREDAVSRFAELLRDALRVEKPRRKTRPPRRAKEARMREKRMRSERKKLRRPPESDE